MTLLWFIGKHIFNTTASANRNGFFLHAYDHIKTNTTRQSGLYAKMPITKDHRRIAGLRKGVVCLAADKKGTTSDREIYQCINTHRQKSKGSQDKTRSISVQNSRRYAVVETVFDSGNRRFSCSDALVKCIPRARNRGLILKNNANAVQQKRQRSCKNERASIRSSNLPVLHWEAIPYSEENLGKLIEVYGKNNVGKTSFLQHLKSTKENVTKDQQCSSIVFTNSNSQTCFTFKNILRESLLEKRSSDDREADACVVMFSVSDKASFQFAKLCVQNIRRGYREDIPVFLVANKSDMIRYRKVSTNDAIRVADIHNCQYFETTLTMNYNVDELLREIHTQIERSATEAHPKCFRQMVRAFQSKIKRVFCRE